MSVLNLPDVETAILPGTFGYDRLLEARIALVPHQQSFITPPSEHLQIVIVYSGAVTTSGRSSPAQLSMGNVAVIGPKRQVTVEGLALNASELIWMAFQLKPLGVPSIEVGQRAVGGRSANRGRARRHALMSRKRANGIFVEGADFVGGTAPTCELKGPGVIIAHQGRIFIGSERGGFLLPPRCAHMVRWGETANVGPGSDSFCRAFFVGF